MLLFKKRLVAVRSLLMAASFCGLVSCKTIYPTVTASPGPGRSAADLDADRAACSREVQARVTPLSAQLNANLSRSTSQMEADNAKLQQAVDAVFSDCMRAKGNIVAAPAASQANTSNSPAPALTAGWPDDGKYCGPGTKPDAIGAQDAIFVDLHREIGPPWIGADTGSGNGGADCMNPVLRQGVISAEHCLGNGSADWGKLNNMQVINNATIKYRGVIYKWCAKPLR